MTDPRSRCHLVHCLCFKGEHLYFYISVFRCVYVVVQVFDKFEMQMIYS